ncbi:MAG: hypothetical protein ACFB0C_14905 [Leptolyngbyaceae cyanobacterium]
MAPAHDLLPLLRIVNVVIEKASHPTSQPSSALGALNANQIVYLAQGNTCLYGEVIQVVESRDRCWVRPLALVEISPDSSAENICYRTPQGPDVIWPLPWFTPALDTDWLAILTELSQAPGYDRATANQWLRQLWQARNQARI